MKRLTFISVFALVCAYSPKGLAAPKVLALPFTDESVYVVQGWHYNEYGPDGAHEGIDFKKGGSFQYEPFDVHAAYNGSLWCQGGDNGGYGNLCFIEHSVNGIFFYTVYAHLDWFISNGPVVQGQKIGVAGKTGSKSGGVIHLHFEIQTDELCYNADCRRDPYDIYATNVSYPKPPTNPMGLMGSNHWWVTDPPTTSNGMPDETCFDGIQNQAETGIDCGGSCPPCNPSECTDGDRRRCWVECTQQAQLYPPECIFVNGPLLMGIETCIGGQWGMCATTDGMTCAQISNPCNNQSLLPASFECVDGTAKDGAYLCINQLGINCTTAFYTGWPPHDCPQDLCLSGDDGCLMDNETRPCEIYCDEPGGRVIQGTQTCNSYCGFNLAWSQCNPNLVNNVSPCL